MLIEDPHHTVDSGGSLHWCHSGVLAGADIPPAH